MTAADHRPQGPLRGVRVIEIAGIGPAPFCGMLLSDMGADILRIDRPDPAGLGLPVEPRFDITSRGRRSVCLDLKQPASVEAVLELARRADVLIEGMRPGVMERLGLGPEPVLSANPKLVYGRVTGWGQAGPLAHAAGHDMNYIALAGALHAIGDAAQPAVPLNLLGDYGGGAAYLAIGVLAALHEAGRSGKGQVIDAAMVDGAASLMALFYGHLAAGAWHDRRGSNTLDGAAPWYRVYPTSDGKHITIGAIEPKFFQELLARLGLSAADWPRPHDPACWSRLGTALGDLFRSRTRAEWCELLEGSDACFAPVLSLREAPQHPHLVARDTFVDIEGVTQPGPAPRFSRTPGAVSGPAPAPGDWGEQALRDWGFNAGEIVRLAALGMKWISPVRSAGQGVSAPPQR